MLITKLDNFEPQGLRTKFELDLMELQMTGLAKVHHVLTHNHDIYHKQHNQNNFQHHNHYHQKTQVGAWNSLDKLSLAR